MSFDRSALPPLKTIIADHELRAEKKFGQNFLLDANITDKIVKCAPNLAGQNVIEIGPGPGGLTRSLLCSSAKTVTAIEFDPRAVAALEHLCNAAGDRFRLIEGDALKIDVLSEVEPPRALVANLPYNVATPLLIGWLKNIAQRGAEGAFKSMTLMFQKEVAQRITARCGDKAYGRLSVLCQWLCDVHMAYVLPAEAFTPPPKVQSAIVTFKPKARTGDQPDFKMLERVTEAAFGQRRKMIRSSLKDYQAALLALGLDPTLRAENLSVDDYIRLALQAPS